MKEEELENEWQNIFPKKKLFKEKVTNFKN